ncbi:hypothetical protein JK358_09605 [Nocardia sp. 2]|uniref:Uncharacterized protein n=1 Tax=Nocardia acididurans TaxID=2802282 RepID=A0ABS1M1X0_9NOCA|nr:hypothetical protein [Nocardia acididurans]MBL1074652.1 hypothetical protein [Nocardia acididurans]
MRTYVHLLLFACAVAMAVGVLGPLVGSVDARDVRFSDLREGFDTGLTLDQVGGQSAALPMSLGIIMLGAALVVLIAALVGSRVLGWIGVLGGLACLGVLIWRLDERFDDLLRDDYRALLSGTWGLYLFGGGVALALLALLVPRERRRAPVPVPH